MAATTRRVTADLWPAEGQTEGRVITCVAVWGGLSDRVAFEREYAIAWNVQVQDMLRAAREDRDDPTRRDERGAFMAWRMLRRAHPDDPDLKDFEAFVEACREIELQRVDVETVGTRERVNPSLDPTEPDPRTETSPS